MKNQFLNLGKALSRAEQRSVNRGILDECSDIQALYCDCPPGTYGKQGRSYDSKKKKAVIAVELTNKHQVKRVYIKSIDDYSCKSLTPIFEEHIDTSAKVFTDKWRGYEPLKEKYNITQIRSDNGKNFKKLHIIIHQVKSWLRTIPTHVSKEHVQKYFDEFSYRINRSQSKKSIWHNTIMKMVYHRLITQYQIIQKLN